jgi:hypothetical protein
VLDRDVEAAFLLPHLFFAGTGGHSVGGDVKSISLSILVRWMPSHCWLFISVIDFP